MRVDSRSLHKGGRCLVRKCSRRRSRKRG
ncbi:unnamed protein product [Ectocarpus sp. CCAP 1310/34]|nr:unnamed protein product [Ectocarpus sp. CCAP 1310/34]